MPEYTLVNPIIRGNFQIKYSDDNAETAASKLWENLSSHIMGNVPRFAFTMANLNDGSLHNFVVSEKIKKNGGKGLSYTIKKIDNKLNSQQQKDFLNKYDSMTNKINNIGQSGGKDEEDEEKKDKKKKRRFDDDDSDSSDDEDMGVIDLYGNLGYFRTKYLNQPIAYWWYTPLLYQLEGYTSVYLPTFRVPIVPYIEINLSSAFF